MASDDEQIPVSELKKRFEPQSQSVAPPRTKPSKQVEASPELHESQQVEPKHCSDSSTYDSSVTDNEMRLVLIGITGSGKSASGNTILGEKLFHSIARSKSITKTCQVEHKTRFGRDLVIIDTPGAFDTESKQEENKNEIIKCITMSAPGPHAFIMVIKTGRFTPEEQNTIKYFEKVFGKALFDYLFLLFTRVEDIEKDGETLEDFLADPSEDLNKLISACGRRYVGFNNDEKDEKKKEKMVLQLMDMIQENVEKKHGEYYTSELLEIADQEVQKMAQEILKKEEEKMQKEQMSELNTKIDKLEEEFRRKALNEARAIAGTNPTVLERIAAFLFPFLGFGVSLFLHR